ncbi:hypothetical protein EDB82DRAFT_490821 [Fusarium venenatum]|uniref:uncharacterized protein n=1 Tax=Fusarium venenatum TaxID=56646 RepID=UPI001D56B1DF|nr:hypothetical protein EDB82DRAFT_490821 [Fusarium venenatum]
MPCIDRLLFLLFVQPPAYLLQRPPFLINITSLMLVPAWHSHANFFATRLIFTVASEIYQTRKYPFPTDDHLIP